MACNANADTQAATQYIEPANTNSKGFPILVVNRGGLAPMSTDTFSMCVQDVALSSLPSLLKARLNNSVWAMLAMTRMT
jgi:hypothetical protein